LVAYQAQIGFVHQRRRLKGISRALISQLETGEAAELIDDQRDKPIRCPRVARANLFQENGDFAT
jgi:hypothetical protein